jgi:hypothetical protein
MPKTSSSDGMRKPILALRGLSVVLLCAAVLPPAIGAETAQIPNFAPDNMTGWLKPAGDEFIAPESGPGPVRADSAHP